MVKPRKRKTETDEAYINRASLEYYNAGLHIVEIAKKLDKYGATIIDVFNAVVPNNKITTNEEREIMIRLRDEGKSISQISLITGRSRSCVRKRIDTPANVRINTENPNYLSDSDIDTLKEEYINGSSIAAIAKRLNVSRGSVTYRLKKTGLYDPNKGYGRNRYITKNEVARLKRMYKRGMSFSKIAKKTGHSRDTVSQYIRGVKKPIK